MASQPTLIVLEHSHVSPPPATINDHQSLPLTFFDISWLTLPPLHIVFFYPLPITETQLSETVAPNLKKSLSITLQHFFPFVGKLIVFPTTRVPEIRYVDGDSVAVTFAKCNLDFNDLTGNHPRDCDKFYHLIPLLGHTSKVSDYLTFPVFSVQVTLFENHGISLGLTIHHSLGDASTCFRFLNAWTSIARSGSDESFLANEILPLYDRMVKYPKLDELYLKYKKVETLCEDYQLPRLSGPTDKVRATFILTRIVVNKLKQFVSIQLPTLAYVSSFTIACAYIWSCLANLHTDGVGLFLFVIDCRSRMDPPIPLAYFGNCIMPCVAASKIDIITGKEGFVTAAKLIGENIHKILTDTEGVMKYMRPLADLISDIRPTTTLAVSGTPKIKFYDLDFGFGKPKKHETVSMDYNEAVSINACKDSNGDMEIGVCLSAHQMGAFIRIYNDGLETYI